MKKIKQSTLKWKDYRNGAKHAIVYINNDYKLDVILGKSYFSNGVNNFEVRLLFNNEICYDLHEDVWKYQTIDDINNIIQLTKNLNKSLNDDVPKDTIIHILQEKIKRQNKEIGELTTLLHNDADINCIINKYCKNLNIKNEEAYEAKRNPYYLKLLKEYNNSHENETHDIIYRNFIIGSNYKIIHFFKHEFI